MHDTLAMREAAQGARIGDYELARSLPASVGGVLEYEATHVLLPRQAHLRVGDDAASAKRLMREACILEALRHPGVPRIYECGLLEDRRPWTALELLDGPTLADAIVDRPLLADEVLAILRDIAEILQHAHGRGIVHCRLRPESIVRQPTGLCITTWAGACTHDGAPQLDALDQQMYLAPELVLGARFDGRADIYSLGVTLFKAATGVLPFTGEDWYEIARQHVEDRPPRPRSLNPALSRDLEDVILKCLEKDPDDRYQSGEALAQDLAELLQDRGESATFRTLVVPAADTASNPALPRVSGRRRRSRDNRKVAGIAAAVLVLGGAALWFGQRGEAADRADGVRPGPLPFDTLVDSMALHGPNPPGLAVTAPPEAEIFVDGVQVARGEWRGDSLSPGRHVVAASIAAEPGCPSARVEQAVMVADTGLRAVRLDPRACGSLVLDMLPATAAYEISGPRTVRGRGPANEPITLPTGSYRVKVEEAQCAPYSNPGVRIDKGSRTSLRIRLICG